MPEYAQCECRGLGPVGYGDLRGHFIGCPLIERTRAAGLEQLVTDLEQRVADHERQLSDVWDVLGRSANA